MTRIWEERETYAHLVVTKLGRIVQWGITHLVLRVDIELHFTGEVSHHVHVPPERCLVQGRATRRGFQLVHVSLRGYLIDRRHINETTPTTTCLHRQ
jgi:hypothetical protein